ncbi:unnamed protein product, partial [Didymodactylos carnosus]
MCSNPSGSLTANALVAVMTRSASRKQQQQLPQTTTIHQLPIPADSSPTIVLDKSPFTADCFDIQKLKEEQDKDPKIQKKIKALEKNPNMDGYSIEKGILHKLVSRSHATTKQKLPYIPSSMLPALFRAFHDDPLAGHFSVNRTYHKLQCRYWWPEMKNSIENYIKSCLKCRQFNISRQKKSGKLCPIPPPSGPFEFIGMDFCGPFQSTPNDNKYVLVITDYYSRW